MPNSRSMTSAKCDADTPPRFKSATNRSPACIASSQLDWLVKLNSGRLGVNLRPTSGAKKRNAAIKRPASRSHFRSCSALTPVCLQEKLPSQVSLKGSARSFSDTPNFSTASMSSSAVTRRAPVSMSEMVRRFLKPNNCASSHWESSRSSRSALIRAPIYFAVIGTSSPPRDCDYKYKSSNDTSFYQQWSELNFTPNAIMLAAMRFTDSCGPTGTYSTDRCPNARKPFPSQARGQSVAGRPALQTHEAAQEFIGGSESALEAQTSPPHRLDRPPSDKLL